MQKNMPQPEAVFLSLGSNSANALANLRGALAEIEKLPYCSPALISPVFFTEPQLFHDQPWFLNLAAMCWLEPGIGPESFLADLQAVEKKLGRDRTREERYGPRPVDIDIVLFGQHESASAYCALPHPSAARRAFVLAPLLSIAPGLAINGESLKDLLGRLDWRIEGFKIWQNDAAGP